MVLLPAGSLAPATERQYCPAGDVAPTVKWVLRRRRLIAGGVLYVALWALTQLAGTGHVRTAVAEKHMPIGDCTRLRTCESTAVAVAPFLIKAQYFWDSGTLAGEGASTLYVWVGGPGLEILRWNVIMI